MCGAEFAGCLRAGEPQIRLRLAHAVDAAFDFAFVEKLRLRRIIAAEDEAIIPAAEVADHLHVGAADTDAVCIGSGEGAREAPESAVHGHEQIVFANVTNARPFGVPAVGTVVAVADFRQTKRMPLASVQ